MGCQAQLVDAIRLIEDFDDELSRRIVRMDRFQQICALSDYFREAPSEEDVEEFLEIGGHVRNFVAEHLPKLSEN